MTGHYPEFWTGADGIKREVCRCGNAWPCPDFKPGVVAPFAVLSPAPGRSLIEKLIRAEREACLADLEKFRAYEGEDDPFDLVVAAINARPLAGIAK